MKGMVADIIWDDFSNVPRKQDAGGQSAKRYQKNREIMLNQWFKEVNNILLKTFEDKYSKVNLLLGINKCNENNFFKQMHSYVREKVLAINSISYINVNGCMELIEKCSKELKQYQTIEDKQLVDEFSKLLAKESPTVDYGLNALDKNKNKVILYSNLLSNKEKEKINEINCEKHELIGFSIIDSFKVCVINYF